VRWPKTWFYRVVRKISTRTRAAKKCRRTSALRQLEKRTLDCASAGEVKDGWPDAPKKSLAVCWKPSKGTDRELVAGNRMPQGVSSVKPVMYSISVDSLRCQPELGAGFCGRVSPWGAGRSWLPSAHGRSNAPTNALEVQEVLTDDKHCDQPQYSVITSLLEQGLSCSISTHAPLAAGKQPEAERAPSAAPPNPQPIPRLQSHSPNQVWTWDIAKLATKQAWAKLPVAVTSWMDFVQPLHRGLDCFHVRRNSALSSQLMLRP